jgi:predicted nucleotidyltransferase
MFTREFCINYASEFVAKLKTKGIDIKIAKIFGSYSNGSATEISDIDLLLVSGNFKGAGFIDNMLFAEELIDYDKIHVKTYSYEDYQEGDPFIEEIEKDAIVIN